MIPSPFASKDKIQVGNDAGWLLAFHKEEIDGVAKKPEVEFGRDDYYADIQVSLPPGLEPGSYTFTIVGLTDKDYGKISLSKEGNPRVIRLYLYWRDAIPGVLNGIGAFVKPIAALADTLGPSKSEQLKDFLVAELQIESIKRKAGPRRYETTITATERMFYMLDKRSFPVENQGPVKAADLKTAFSNFFLRTSSLEEDVDYIFHEPKKNKKTPPPEASAPDEKERTIPLDRLVLKTLKDLGNRMERESGCYGRGMYLIRNGKLHVGKRPIPLTDDDHPNAQPKALTPRGGLIEVEVVKELPIDPNFKGKPGEEPPKRKQYQLTLKGRPDVKPGDMALFDVAEGDQSSTKPALAGLLGALADTVTGPLIPTLSDDVSDKAVLMYVSSVQHKLGKDSGFVSIVTGVGVGTKESAVDEDHQDDFWDGRASPSSGRAKIAHANVEGQLGQAIQGVIDNALGDIFLAEVGEVREADAAKQTLRLWRGLEDGTAEAFEARKLDIKRPTPDDEPAAPYLTPFAWSQCGLILPRYPGTRVLIDHRNGSGDDPVEIGALWKKDDVPKKAKPGDWWLILPAAADPKDKFDSDDDKPQAYSKAATHDLIDADGNRIIETGALTIRVGKDKLTAAGERPKDAKADSIVIEHKGRAVLTVDDQGNITIDAGSKDITLSAANVKVKVSGSMDVGDK